MSGLISPEQACAMFASIHEFKKLDFLSLEVVRQACRLHHYAAGKELIRYQDHTTDVFFILQGSIRVTYYSAEGQEVILCDLSAGEILGELTAIDGQARSAQAIVTSDSLVASMSSSAFLDLLQTNPPVCLAIMKRLTAKVRHLTERIYDFSTLAVRNRIHAELLRLAKNQMATPNTAIISPAPTHLDMANRISTHREAVTRELNDLVHAKLLLKKNRELHILDMARLAKMVDKVRGCPTELDIKPDGRLLM